MGMAYPECIVAPADGEEPRQRMLTAVPASRSFCFGPISPFKAAVFRGPRTNHPRIQKRHRMANHQPVLTIPARHRYWTDYTAQQLGIAHPADGEPPR